MKIKGYSIFTILALALVVICLGVGQTSAEKRKPSPEQIGKAIKARTQYDPNWLKNFTPGAEVMIQATPQRGVGAALHSTSRSDERRLRLLHMHRLSALRLPVHRILTLPLWAFPLRRSGSTSM